MSNQSPEASVVASGQTLANPITGERFEVIERQIRFRLGLRTRVAGPGDVVEVAPGVMHAFANARDEETRLRVEVRPALAMRRPPTERS
jgi:quercetin dioxygenase-like cupin family protein